MSVSSEYELSDEEVRLECLNLAKDDKSPDMTGLMIRAQMLFEYVRGTRKIDVAEEERRVLEIYGKRDA